MDFSIDIAGFGASLALLAAYHGYLRYRLSKDPGYTLQGVNNLVRTAWVADVMRRRGLVKPRHSPSSVCAILAARRNSRRT